MEKKRCDTNSLYKVNRYELREVFLVVIKRFEDFGDTLRFSHISTSRLNHHTQPSIIPIQYYFDSPASDPRITWRFFAETAKLRA